MQRMVDKAIDEFRSARAVLKHEEVPEWGEGVRVYWQPAWTLGERAAVYKQHIGKSPGPDLFIDVLIEKAVDESGKELFHAADRPDLLHRVRPAIIERLAVKMLADMNDVAPPEDLEKN